MPKSEVGRPDTSQRKGSNKIKFRCTPLEGSTAQAGRLRQVRRPFEMRQHRLSCVTADFNSLNKKHDNMGAVGTAHCGVK